MQVAIRRAIIVCALGWFIDIFDVQLFAVLRVPSLKELGISSDQMSVIGGYILNAQMFGMVLGAFLWGWIGDRFGRLKALYGSILVYSFGTLTCAFVHDPITYGVCRFITGFGLSGETGVAATLIAELMSKEKRGWGLTAIGGFGNFGPVLAIALSWYLEWRTAYLVAGIIGLALFVLRIKLLEPALFQKAHQAQHMMGSLKLLIRPKQALIFLCCVAIGLPLTYAVNMLNFYSLEISQVVLQTGEVFNQKLCMLLFYLGLGTGAVSINAISQLWQSRRKALFAFTLLGIAEIIVYLLVIPAVKVPSTVMYGINFTLGFSFATLALVQLVAAEHFGTNIRATSATLVANIVRAGVIPMIFALQLLKGTNGITNAAAVIGFVLCIMAILALRQLRETHGIDLDYLEQMKREV